MLDCKAAPTPGSVNKQLSQYDGTPLDDATEYCQRILRYLRGTQHHGIALSASSNFHLAIVADADLASSPDDRCNTNGSCVLFGDNIVSWSSSKQKVVFHSSTEAEYRSLANTIAELTWYKYLFTEFHLPITSNHLV
ncbi:uncharacterized mitochondrial protein AtMg00810-like [Humulus lupulus]|uniref:uncharacterized mitochondrial protein AtMg00810-like n=1 Tax=Humulus lupulus TaxID=3486 RepID=UPI002B412FB3|nr:uncharacterized mitochondrial protein AtMg00810-like [Humulus lupulus]